MKDITAFLTLKHDTYNPSHCWYCCYIGVDEHTARLLPHSREYSLDNENFLDNYISENISFEGHILEGTAIIPITNVAPNYHELYYYGIELNEIYHFENGHNDDLEYAKLITMKCIKELVSLL